MLLHEYFDKYFEEVLVPNAAVEDLLDENFFIGVLESGQELV